MQLLVLGSAAGGGFPQWNCGCHLCALARAGDPRALPRTQVGMAASADGEAFVLIGASPDLRQQILANPVLAPRAPRHSPIVSVVLLSADIDGIAGLLHLREQQALRIYAPLPILRILEENRVFAVLDPAVVARIAVAPGERFEAAPGLEVTLLEMPGKVPLYHENRAASVAEAAATYAARLDAGARCAVVAPACAEVTDAVLAKLAEADALFFDATLYTDDEMVAAGVGQKTGRRMGHVSISGENGSLARLSTLNARKIYFHINNTNPVLLSGSPERDVVEAAGVEIAYDGMLVGL